MGKYKIEDFVEAVDFDPSATPKVFVATKADETHKRSRVSEKFLKGPVPLSWLRAVAETKCGPAFWVAVMIRHLSDLRQSKTFKASLEDLGAGAYSRYSTSRALRVLENRGLIAIDRKPGQLLRITLLKTPAVAPTTVIQ
jgi:hypothetical protein